MNFETMSKQRKFVLISAVAGIIGMFLPWYTYYVFGSSGSINGMHGNGILAFISFAVAGVMAYLGNQTKNLASTSWIITLICGAIATLIIGWNFMQFGGSGFGASMSLGIYLAFIAAIGVMAAAFLFRSPTDTLKSGFDSFKKDLDHRMKNTNTDSGTTHTTNTHTETTNRETGNTGYTNPGTTNTGTSNADYTNTPDMERSTNPNNNRRESDERDNPPSNPPM